MNINKNNFYLVFIGVFLVILDQITKFLFTNKYYFTDFIIHISFSKNYGSALSSFSQISFYPYLIMVLSIIMLLILIKYRELFSQDIYFKISYTLIISGIIGNFIDRVIFTYVRDFLAIQNLFIFNLADSYLTIAVILIIISEIKNMNIKISENKDLKK